MTSSSKRKGDRAETAACHALRALGFGGCERTRAGYQRDRGDLHLTPGVVAQVKNSKTIRWPEWLAQLAEQIIEARADHGFLIVKRPGMGQVRADQWLAVMTVEAITRLLRAAGYGDPTNPTRAQVEATLDHDHWCDRYGIHQDCCPNRAEHGCTCTTADHITTLTARGWLRLADEGETAA